MSRIATMPSTRAGAAPVESAATTQAMSSGKRRALAFVRWNLADLLVARRNDAGGEDCVAMSGTGKSSAWNDDGCSFQKPYLCHQVTAPSQTIVQDAFVLHKVDEMTTGIEGYDSAEAVCRAQGRGLASIHNGEQQQAVLELMEAQGVHAALVGLIDRGRNECGCVGVMLSFGCKRSCSNSVTVAGR